MSVEQNKAVVTKFQDEVLVGRRFDLFDEAIHPDYTLNAGEKDEVKGREAARRGFVELMHNPKATFKRIDIFGEGDKVVVRWESFDGEKRYKGISLFRLADGKIKDDFYCAEEIK